MKYRKIASAVIFAVLTVFLLACGGSRGRDLVSVVQKSNEQLLKNSQSLDGSSAVLGVSLDSSLLKFKFIMKKNLNDKEKQDYTTTVDMAKKMPFSFIKMFRKMANKNETVMSQEFFEQIVERNIGMSIVFEEEDGNVLADIPLDAVDVKIYVYAENPPEEVAKMFVSRYRLLDEDSKVEKVESKSKKADRDEDGVPDEEDECPGEFGHRLLQGCPVGNPDPDEDGVCEAWVQEKGLADELSAICTGVDACPNEAGAGKDGCPLSY